MRLVTTAYQRNLDREDNARTSLAWHIEAFARQNKLPDLSRLMGIEAKCQSDEDMERAVDLWMAQHNAKYALAVRLGEV